MTKEELVKLEYKHDNLVKEMNDKHFLEQQRIKDEFWNKFGEFIDTKLNK